jgi:hypothetical protein
MPRCYRRDGRCSMLCNCDPLCPLLLQYILDGVGEHQRHEVLFSLHMGRGANRTRMRNIPARLSSESLESAVIREEAD